MARVPPCLGNRLAAKARRQHVAQAGLEAALPLLMRGNRLLRPGKLPKTAESFQNFPISGQKAVANRKLVVFFAGKGGFVPGMLAFSAIFPRLSISLRRHGRVPGLRFPSPTRSRHGKPNA
jgi:hypothetical protein